jgi:glucose-1-phosphate thymidylyltransferase
MKGVILAGGSGTRLYPLTLTVSKQLMPVYDKPMVYYPLSTLMLAGIRDVAIISTPRDLPMYQHLLGDGSRLGMHFEYIVQEKPEGLAQAFILAADFIGSDSVVLILGDNIFYGSGLSGLLQDAYRSVTDHGGHLIFGYHVSDPERSGVVEFDADGNVLSIEEKPQQPKSSYAIPGLYFLDNQVVEIAKQLQPSARGELEIVDVHNAYLAKHQLKVKPFPRGIAWLDTGTHASLLQAGEFVHIVEERQGFKIGCIEEVAYRMGYIDARQLADIAEPLTKSGYGQYLLDILNEDDRAHSSHVA